MCFLRGNLTKEGIIISNVVFSVPFWLTIILCLMVMHKVVIESVQFMETNNDGAGIICSELQIEDIQEEDILIR